ncbi:MFS transporter [Amycolatopsis sp. GM8]|uniref:MFS transporter n=1 Tax=Amycolatopsis sp. GM8 TaxID=2896530 RepID=UPI001F21678C|nr:MFS transporter [Amycolatopsis sp. GM8]
MDYWRLWTSSASSNLADGVLKVALPLAALGLTRSPSLIAGLAFAFTVPWLLFALPAGVLADRYDRRKLMLAANLARAALLGVLVVAVTAGAGSIAFLYVVAFAVGTAETVHDTAAQSIVPQLVPRERLPKANGRLYAAELTANELAGPPLAGFLVAAGVTIALVTPGALWIFAVAALALVRGSFRVKVPPATIRADIAEGVRFLARDRVLRSFTVVVGVFNFASSASQAILVLYAVGPMRLSEQGYGWLLSTFAAGSLAGSFLAGRAGPRALPVSLAFGAIAVGIPALTTNPYVAGAGFFLGGAGLIVANVLTVSLRQSLTPAHLLGRVNSSHRLVAFGTKPLGALAGGVLAQFLGLRPVFAVMGLLALAVIPVVVRAPCPE